MMAEERQDPRADESEVDVVRAHLGDFTDLSRFRAVLSEEERSRADGYKVQEPRDVFTLARGLLRIELAKRLGVLTGDIQFDVRPEGKPELRPGTPGRPDWRFSVSHTGPHAAVAFALGHDVGIDIERLDRFVDPLAIAGRYFTPDELQSLEKLPAEARPRAFMAGWTRKEAIVKARGSTMAESLNTLSVDLDPEAIHPRSDDAPSAPKRAVCRLTTFDFPALRLVGAVALQSDRAPRLTFRVFSGTGFD